MSSTHVFISYSHNDIAVTEELARYLESVGLKCWYAPRDIAPGAAWAESIVSAIQDAPYFILIFSDSSNQSDQVYSEVDMACKTSDTRHTVISFRISNAEICGRLSYYINSRQWVDGVNDRGRAYVDLARQIREGLGMGGVDPAVTKREETSEERRERKEKEKEQEIIRKEKERVLKEQEKQREKQRQAEEKEQERQEKEKARQEKIEKWKKFPIKQILIGIAAAIAVVIVLFVFFTHKETVSIRLNDYVSVKYDGYDTYGTALLSIDYDGLQEALDSSEWKSSEVEALFEGEEDAEESYADTFMETFTVYDVLYSIIGEDACALSASEGLSNGDTVQLIWAVDEEQLDQLNQIAYCSISYDDGEELIVSGLTEIETFDPFEAVSLSYSGMSGDGEAELSFTSSGEMAEAITYSISETKGLFNGQSITVTVTNDPDEFEAAFGVRLAAIEKSYTVTGLSSYVTSAEDITDEVIAHMQSELEDHFNAYVASDWNLEKFTVLGLDYIGYYFLSEKSDSSPHNMVFVVYQVNVEYYVNDNSGFIDELITYYYYGGFENLIMLSDGSISVDYLALSTPAKKFSADNATFYGYQTLDSLFSDVVTTQIDDYTSVSQVSDQEYDYEPQHAEDESDGDIAYLGIAGVDVSGSTAETFDMPEGIYVTVVIEGGAAEASGLRRRDIITAADGKSVLTREKLQNFLDTCSAGDEIVLTVQRVNDAGDYEAAEISVILGDSSANEAYEQAQSEG